MGLLDGLGDTLKGVVGKLEATSAPALIDAALSKTSYGNLQGLLDSLKKEGLDQQVKSWLGSGANLPVSAEQLKAALGNEQVKKIAEHFGIPVDAALKFLSEHLPAVVDNASPTGELKKSSV